MCSNAVAVAVAVAQLIHIYNFILLFPKIVRGKNTVAGEHLLYEIAYMYTSPHRILIQSQNMHKYNTFRIFVSGTEKSCDDRSCFLSFCLYENPKRTSMIEKKQLQFHTSTDSTIERERVLRLNKKSSASLQVH